MDMHQEVIEIIDKEFISFLRIAEEFYKNDSMISYFQGLVKGYARCFSRIRAISFQEYSSVTKCIYCVPEVIILLKSREFIDPFDAITEERLKDVLQPLRNEVERKE